MGGSEFLTRGALTMGQKTLGHQNHIIIQLS